MPSPRRGCGGLLHHREGRSEACPGGVRPVPRHHRVPPGDAVVRRRHVPVGDRWRPGRVAAQGVGVGGAAGEPAEPGHGPAVGVPGVVGPAVPAEVGVRVAGRHGACPAG
ncbi:hypothetical protein pZL12.3c [Streptomyces phage ZL12]|uniref:Uncharacterized protein n=1 Tax=Streptomyces phage ZL12 TaxID=2570911 RepID=D0UWA8_9CAUD|nr:hypothetical protein QEH43_gp003 [Streptomyces phage ZL12]ACX71080.1 hypothetical protein pZL12.3c [Streptomyces phage ZL12]